MWWRSAAAGIAAIALATALSGCSPQAEVTALDEAKAENQAHHVSDRFEPHPVVLDDPDGFETSRLFFSASETVVVADSTQEAQLRAASVAVTAHAPLVIYTPEMHSKVIGELQRLGAHTVLTVGNVALAPAGGRGAEHVAVQRDPGGLDALHTMTSLQFDVREVADPAEAAASVAGLAADPPTWLRAAADPVVMPGAEAKPFPLQSRRDADMAPVVVATPRSSLAAIANARSFGARVSVQAEPDPRSSEDTLMVMAGLSRDPLIALGAEFGSGEELASKIEQAEQSYT